MRRYRAVATGGETSDTRNGARSGPGASRRARTYGHTHITAGPRPREASRRIASDASNSSPQLAGTATENPRRRHACASCTGVAGAAASTTSLPTIATIGTGRRSPAREELDMWGASCCPKQARETQHVQTEWTLQTSHFVRVREKVGCCWMQR